MWRFYTYAGPESHMLVWIFSKKLSNIYWSHHSYTWDYRRGRGFQGVGPPARLHSRWNDRQSDSDVNGTKKQSWFFNMRPSVNFPLHPTSNIYITLNRTFYARGVHWTSTWITCSYVPIYFFLDIFLRLYRKVIYIIIRISIYVKYIRILYPSIHGLRGAGANRSWFLVRGGVTPWTVRSVLAFDMQYEIIKPHLEMLGDFFFPLQHLKCHGINTCKQVTKLHLLLHDFRLKGENTHGVAWLRKTAISCDKITGTFFNN